MRQESVGGKARSFGMNMAVGAVVGAGVVLLFGRLGPGFDAEGLHMPALIVAGLLAVMGLYILAGGLSPAVAAQMLDSPVEAGEDLAEERRLLLLQGVVSLLAAVELALLAMPPEWLTGPAMPALLASLAALLAVQTWLNIRIWRSGDEFFRRILVEAMVISAVVFQFGLFLWAVGGRFGFLPEPSVLDVYVALTAVYLVGSGIAGSRRGYG